MLNTRFDYEYARQNNLPGWKDAWLGLLERWTVEDNDLVEDQNAPIFRLGFTVLEVTEAIQFAGYTPRQLEWYTSQPDRYELLDGQYVEVADYAAHMLEAAKQRKRIELQTEKVRRRDAGLTIDGILWDTDAAAQVMYTQFAVELLSNPSVVVDDWKASSGVFAPMDAATFQRIRAAWADHCTSITSAQRRKEAEIQALSAVADVEAYNCEVGW